MEDTIISVSLKNIFLFRYLTERDRFSMDECLPASWTLGVNIAARVIRALVVDHLFPCLCVNNLVQNRAINKFTRVISSITLSVHYHRWITQRPDFIEARQCKRPILLSVDVVPRNNKLPTEMSV